MQPSWLKDDKAFVSREWNAALLLRTFSPGEPLQIKHTLSRNWTNPYKSWDHALWFILAYDERQTLWKRFHQWLSPGKAPGGEAENILKDGEALRYNALCLGMHPLKTLVVMAGLVILCAQLILQCWNLFRYRGFDVGCPSAYVMLLRLMNKVVLVNGLAE